VSLGLPSRDSVAIVEVRLRRGYSILNATDGYTAAALRKEWRRFYDDRG
jgi:hypothetical protein